MDKKLLKEKYDELARYQKDRYALGSEMRKVNQKYSNCLREDFIKRKRERSDSDIVETKKKISSIVTVPKYDEDDYNGMTTISTKKIQSVINYPNHIKMNENESKQRNKNMINNLLTHLNKAKIKLESDTPIIKKQEVITKKAEELSKQRESLAKDQQIEELADQREALYAESNIINSNILKCEKEIESLTKKCYETNLSNHLRTQAKPSIFWKPQRYNEKIYQYKSTLSSKHDFLFSLDDDNDIK